MDVESTLLTESFEAKLDGVQIREAKNANIISIHSFQICSTCKISLLVDKVVRNFARGRQRLHVEHPKICSKCTFK